MSVKDIDMKNTINKFDTMLELIENLRGSFNNICDYLDETWKISSFQENTSSLERKNGENFVKFFDSDRFSIMNDACMDMLDQFCNLAESSSDELEHARVVASVWADSTGIPEKKFSSLNINENAGGMNYREVMQKRCQQMTSLYHEQCGMYFKKHKEGDLIIPKLPILRTTRTYDARQLDNAIDKWLSEAKQRPYKVDIEKIEFDSSGRVTGLMVLVNNILKAGITLKYDDINGSFISFVRISVFAHHEKKTIRETSDTIEFQRITQIGLNWLNELDPNDPFPILLDWISSYHDLYTAKCKKCDKILSHESYHYKYLPSVLRVLVNGYFVPYHWQCYNS